MPPKSTATKAKATTSSSHGSFQDMITDAITTLKERNGSSRSAIKKYVKANNTITSTDAMFDSQFNRAIKTGVEKGVFAQPKGPSGTVKLAKKEPKPAAAKPAAKPKVEKKTVAKKPAVKKAVATKKAAPKKAAAAPKVTKAKAAPKPKAAAAKPKATKAKPAAKPKKAAAPKSAPAVVEKPTVLSKTKSGRVTKTAAKPTPKKAAPKKKATPKKAAAKA